MFLLNDFWLWAWKLQAEMECRWNRPKWPNPTQNQSCWGHLPNASHQRALQQAYEKLCHQKKIMQCRHRLHNTVHNIIVIKIDKVIHDVSFLSCIFYHNFASTLTYWSIPKTGDVLYIVLGPSRYTFDGLNNLLAAAFDFEDHEVGFLVSNSCVSTGVFCGAPPSPGDAIAAVPWGKGVSLPDFTSLSLISESTQNRWWRGFQLVFFCLRHMVPKECVPSNNFGFQLRSREFRHLIPGWKRLTKPSMMRLEVSYVPQFRSGPCKLKLNPMVVV